MYHSGNTLIDPMILFEKAQLQPEMHVADFGCGKTGHIVFPASQIVGEKGVVYAVDILKDDLKQIQKRAELSSIHNIHTVWGNMEAVGKISIPAQSLDIVFVVNTLSKGFSSDSVLQEAGRLLKEKGRIIVADWSTPIVGIAPPTQMLTSPKRVRDVALKQEFFIQEEFEAGPHHFGIVLFKQE